MSVIHTLTVAKFGGTSVADYDAMHRCADIIINNLATKVVVVSASSGVTNKLVALTQATTTDEQRKQLIKQIASIQYQILDRLGNPSEVAAKVDAVLCHISELAERLVLSRHKAVVDELLSQGEMCSSIFFAAVLREKGVSASALDVKLVMRTDSHHGRAEPQIEAISELAELYLTPLLASQVIVTQGFVGADAEGATTTLGRGGSDYSAALLAEALRATSVEIWTDVAGIYTTDPRLAPNAKPIPEISFNEAAEMATFGAKVLHPATILPAVRQKIQVFVGSSWAPEQGAHGSAIR